MLSVRDDRVVMDVNGLKCAFHMPAALVPRYRRKDSAYLWLESDDPENRGEEITQNLPPGAPRFVHQVDEYPACPANWMHGSSKASSYWLPIRTGSGMWLDFNYNYEHSHHVAVVVSIQGVNPITGLKTDQLRLEQYRENCPKHNVEFGQDRYCEECGYKWDAQNYLCSNATPRGLFWLDGFRGEDGVVRQYVFTEETCKGVATNIIGDDRVFAIGIAFYLSKLPKPVKALPPEMGATKYCGDMFKGGTKLTGFPPSNTISPSVRITTDVSVPPPFPCMDIDNIKLEMLANNPQMMGVNVTTDYDMDCDKSVSPSEFGHDLLKFTPEEVEQEMKKLEITAGARIRQRNYPDPENPDFWRDDPEGFPYLNYVDIETAEKILAYGRQKRSGSYLDQLSV